MLLLVDEDVIPPAPPVLPLELDAMPPVPPLLLELIVPVLELVEPPVDPPPVPVPPVPVTLLLLPQPIAALCSETAATANVSHERRFIRLLLLGPRRPARALRKSPGRASSPTTIPLRVGPHATRANAVRLRLRNLSRRIEALRPWSVDLPGGSFAPYV